MAKKIVIRPVSSSNTSTSGSTERKIVVGSRVSQSSARWEGLKELWTRLPYPTLWIGGLALIILLLLGWSLIPSKTTVDPPPPPPPPVKPSPQKSRDEIINIDTKVYLPTSRNLEGKLSLSKWFAQLNVAPGFRQELQQQAQAIGLDTLQEGKFLNEYRDSTGKVRYALYELQGFTYARFQFAPYPQVSTLKFPEETEEISKADMIRDSSLLFLLLVQETGSLSIAKQAEEVLKHLVDFYHLENGDEYKLIYDQKIVLNRVVGTGALKAISIKTYGRTYYAIRCKTEKGFVYLNEYAKSNEKSFLLAPVKNVQISSRYNLDRLHPVLKVVKPHRGTDYAAREGTEIFSVADGVVQEVHADVQGPNGKFVKIAHEKPYMTQYLHMQGFAPGIKPGVRVRMGQVIGYVGQTGDNITGPHVCFRFWKGKDQVDHLAEQFKSITRLNMREEDECRETCERYKQRLEQLVIKSNIIFE